MCICASLPRVSVNVFFSNERCTLLLWTIIADWIQFAIFRQAMNPHNGEGLSNDQRSFCTQRNLHGATLALRASSMGWTTLTSASFKRLWRLLWGRSNLPGQWAKQAPINVKGELNRFFYRLKVSIGPKLRHVSKGNFHLNFNFLAEFPITILEWQISDGWQCNIYESINLKKKIHEL